MMVEGVVRSAGAKKGGTGIGITAWLQQGDIRCDQFQLRSEDEVEDFALRKNLWAGHVLDRGYAPVVPDYITANHFN